MGFTLSHFISQFPPTRFPLLTATEMCHFLPVHHLGIAFLGQVKGQNTIIVVRDTIFLKFLLAMSVLMFGCTTRTLIKHLEKKLNGNYTRMLYAVLNKSLKQHSTKQQLYSCLPTISQTNKTNQTCWALRDVELSVLLYWATTITD